MAKDDVKNFCRAMWRNDIAVIEKLAPRVDPNAKDPWGNTPLLSAARHGDLALVSLLVGRGGEPDQGRTHLTPITYAAKRGAGDIVDFLRERGATVSIVTSIYLGETAVVRRALKRDSGLSALRDEEGTPILHHAAEALRPDLAVLLLDRKSTANDTDANGETALHRIADMRNAPQEQAAQIAKLLLDRGAAVDARNWDGVTPLHQASRARNLEVARVLLERGADPNAQDKSRRSTPLRRAVSGTGASGTAGTASLMAPLVLLLLAHGADPEAPDKRGVPVYASARAPDVVAILNRARTKQRSAE